MSGLYTVVPVPDQGIRISHQSQILLMGSCFADNIGRRLQAGKFRVSHNPFGVVYNPLSLSKQIELLCIKERFETADLEFRNELWFSFMHYTLFSDTDKEACLARINDSFERARNYISTANVLFLTLGTSFAYTIKSTGEVVANCHKLPAKEFSHRFIPLHETVEELKKSIELLRSFNPGLKVVFTVSPIRHWKNGAIDNQRSKAALLLAVAELEKKLPEIYYFPAYEIVMDELRDYRFYAEDLLHPSDFAVDFIWQKYMSAYFGDETKSITSAIEELNKALNHKPRHTNTTEYRKFVKSVIKKAEQLTKKYPSLNFDKEIREYREAFN